MTFDEQLAADLTAMRPTPDLGFAASLDARAAAGFPRRAGVPRRREPRRVFLRLAAAATCLVVVSVAVVESNSHNRTTGSPPKPAPLQAGSEQAAGAGGVQRTSVPPSANQPRENAVPLDATHGRTAIYNGSANASPPADLAAPPNSLAAGAGSRVVESTADLTLAAASDDVPDVADGVVRVTHTYGGIVMTSNVAHGSDGARATFQLAIPSVHLTAAISDLSSLAHVKSDQEGSLDITSPVVRARHAVADDEARLASLRTRLAQATAAGDTLGVDRLTQQIRGLTAQRDARLRQLQQLRHRARYATVSVTVVSDDSLAGNSGWTFTDALHDAGKVLRYAAGIAVVSAAVMLPLALLAAIVAILWRAWVRRSREAALGAPRAQSS